MKQYEIRVFDDKGKTSLVFHRTHSDDQVAIEDAIELAGDRAFDLWRGMDLPVRPQSCSWPNAAMSRSPV